MRNAPCQRRERARPLFTPASARDSAKIHTTITRPSRSGRADAYELSWSSIEEECTRKVQAYTRILNATTLVATSEAIGGD